MVRLDLGCDSRDAGRLDDVRINGALGKPFGVFDSLCVFVKRLDKQSSDDFSLGLRFGNALQLGDEFFGSVGADDVQGPSTALKNGLRPTGLSLVHSDCIRV